jgi:hypothetical protein
MAIALAAGLLRLAMNEFFVKEKTKGGSAIKDLS